MQTNFASNLERGGNTAMSSSSEKSKSSTSNKVLWKYCECVQWSLFGIDIKWLNIIVQTYEVKETIFNF